LDALGAYTLNSYYTVAWAKFDKVLDIDNSHNTNPALVMSANDWRSVGLYFRRHAFETNKAYGLFTSDYATRLH